MSAEGSRVSPCLSFSYRTSQACGECLCRLYLALPLLPGRTLCEQCQQHPDDNLTVMLQPSLWREGGAGNKDGSYL